jgi:hypothetical protein
VSIPYTWVPPSTSPFSLGKDKRTSVSDLYKTVKTIVPEQEKVVLPMWNVVDEGDSTQEKLGRAVADVWGIKYGFLNSTVATLVQQFAKVREWQGPTRSSGHMERASRRVISADRVE